MRRGSPRLGAAAAIVACTCLSAAPVPAKTISISMTPSAEIHDGLLTLGVKVSNSGDDTAQSVTPTLHFRDRETKGKGRPTLAPNESLQESLALPAADLGPGRWPYTLTVDYTDANQYPFQALHVGAVVVGNPPPPKVAVSEVKAPAVSGSGSLLIRLKNLAGAPRAVAVGVRVPEGLELTRAIPEITLAAWEEKVLSAPLVNRTALAGSRYPVFVTVQYDDGPVHQGLVAQSVVEILPPRSFFARQRTLLWIAAATLVLLWVGLTLWRVTGRLGGGRGPGDRS